MKDLCNSDVKHFLYSSQEVRVRIQVAAVLNTKLSTHETV